MLQPSFTGRRPYGILAAAGLVLFLTAQAAAAPIGPADRDRDRHGPSRYVLLLHAYPRLSPPVIRLDEAFRDTLEAEAPFPVYFYTEYLDLTLFDGDVPQQRAPRAPPPEVRIARHRPHRRRRKPRAPRRAAEPGGSVLGGSRRLPQRGPVERHRSPAERRRHRHLAAPELDRDPGSRATAPAGDPSRRRHLGIGALGPGVADSGSPAARGHPRRARGQLHDAGRRSSRSPRRSRR